MTRYILDTNIYINFYERYYLFDYFPSFWAKFKPVLNQQVVLPKIVVDETYQSEWFKNWLEQNFTGAYCNHKNYDSDWATILQHIAQHHCYSEKALTDKGSWTHEKIADGWIVAIAKKEGLTIVSSEIRNPNLNANQPSKSVKIPDIADDFYIPCIDMNSFFVKFL